MKAKVYGYCRVSTMKQSIERQKRDIKEVYPDAIFVTDECTGKNLDRPGWTKLYKQLKPGDTVVFDEVLQDLGRRCARITDSDLTSGIECTSGNSLIPRQKLFGYISHAYPRFDLNYIF